MTLKGAKGKEVEKDGMDVSQTKHIQCRNKMVTLSPVAGHRLVEGSLLQFWTGMLKRAIFVEVRIFEEREFLGQPEILIADKRASQPLINYLVGRWEEMRRMPL